MMDRHILAVIETIENNPVFDSLEVLGLASELSVATGLKITVVMPVNSLKMKRKNPFNEKGFSVCLMENAGLSSYNHELLVKGLVEIAGSLNPEYICFPGTVFSGSAAPFFASLISAPYISSVERVRKVNGRIEFTRPTHGEKYLEEIQSDSGTTVLSARPGSFSYNESPVKSSSGGDITVFNFRCGEISTHIEEVKQAHRESSDIERAEVIVTAGRGAGDEEGIILVKDLAALFKQSAVGGTRPVCDLGLLPYTRQVGSTGRSVSPSLYIACGVSGSSQHIAGMRGSDMIVSINNDPSAPITAVADYILIEDLSGFIPVLVKKYREKYGAG
jgi:electron transfer flavoprotein alpha subunit